MKTDQWHRIMMKARADAALDAYETSLLWLQQYPRSEVHRLLQEAIETKRATLRRHKGIDG